MGEMSDATPQRKANRHSEHHVRTANPLVPDRASIFDKSVYESNPYHTSNPAEKNARRTL